MPIQRQSTPHAVPLRLPASPPDTPIRLTLTDLPPSPPLPGAAPFLREATNPCYAGSRTVSSIEAKESSEYYPLTDHQRELLIDVWNQWKSKGLPDTEFWMYEFWETLVKEIKKYEDEEVEYLRGDYQELIEQAREVLQRELVFDEQGRLILKTEADYWKWIENTAPLLLSDAVEGAEVLHFYALLRCTVGGMSNWLIDLPEFYMQWQQTNKRVALSNKTSSRIGEESTLSNNGNNRIAQTRRSRTPEPECDDFLKPCRLALPGIERRGRASSFSFSSNASPNVFLPSVRNAPSNGLPWTSKSPSMVVSSTDISLIPSRNSRHLQTDFQRPGASSPGFSVRSQRTSTLLARPAASAGFGSEYETIPRTRPTPGLISIPYDRLKGGLAASTSRKATKAFDEYNAL